MATIVEQESCDHGYILKDTLVLTTTSRLPLKGNMMSANLKNVAENIAMVNSDQLRSAVTKFLKMSSVPLESRKRLYGIIKSHRPMSSRFELYPGIFINKPILDIMFGRKLYEAAPIAIEIVKEGITERQQFRQAFINSLKAWGYEFSASDLKNTRLWSAIDNTARLAGFTFVNARYPVKSDKQGMYRKLKVMGEFELFSEDQLRQIASKNIKKIDELYGVKINEII
jgi:hypothetical protein